MSGVEARGLDTLSRSLRDSADDLSDLADLEHAAAVVVAEEAKPRTPRRTGALMATVRADAGKVVAGSKVVGYAGVIMFGSRRRNIVGRNWISDAAIVAEPKILDAATLGATIIIEGIQGE